MTQHAPKVVLLVEDEPDVAEVTADLLEQEGYSVVRARNGRHALDVLAAVEPVAIVLDMMMPELDGLGFLREFATRQAPRPRVLAVSAFEDYLPLALAAGATSALQKPYSATHLLERLSALTGGLPTPAAPAPEPPDEAARVRAVLELALEQPTASDALDAFVQRVARIFEVPVALVNVITADRQISHATCGLPPGREGAFDGPRRDSFCTHAVVARAALVVQDTTNNPLFKDNPFVRERGLRFYAGVPLIERFGRALGTLCILDMKPRVFKYFDLELLSVLAKRVMAEIEWRDRRARTGAPLAAFRHLSYMDEELGVLGREAFVEALQVESLRAAEAQQTLALVVVGVAPEARAATAAALGARFPAGHIARLAAGRFGVLVGGDAAAARTTALAAAGATGRASAAAVPHLLGGVETLLWAVEEELEGYGVVGPAEA